MRINEIHHRIINHRLTFITLCALIACVLLPKNSFAISEKELQLALLLKVSQFATWEERTDETFNFCIYDGKGYESLTSNYASTPEVGNLPVHFEFLSPPLSTQALHQCHLLFIPESSAVETKQLLRRAIHAPTLTISTLEGFAHMGGMIELVKLNNRYTFRINLSPVRKSKLNISASLLEISSVIKEGQ